MELAPYKAWRKTLAGAATTIETVYKEVTEWIDQRTERWEESEIAENLGDDCERLEDALAALRELEALGSQK